MPASPDILSEHHALALDRDDPLREYRDLFHMPPASAASNPAHALSASSRAARAVYLTGNSLGLQLKAVSDAMTAELHDWAALGVEGHLHGRNPWLPYHEMFRHTGARLVGAHAGEVVMMNSLTTNLHLLMVSFYRPTRTRFKIIIEDSAFPSDSYAVASQAAFHNFAPREAIVRLKPRDGEWTLRTDDILSAIEQHGSTTALIMLGGVNYLTGQWFDMPAVTTAAKRAGCAVGWDLAHAAGNVPLQLHDIDADFAAWCSYKYLNAGPGAVAGAFVHDRYAQDSTLPRFAGWWGNDPATRFVMGPDFTPRPGADGWQLSNPPIMAMVPLRVSLELFDKVGMAALREKSLKLTGYLDSLIDAVNAAAPEHARVIIRTPRDPAQRGCQLSLVYPSDPRGFLDRLKAAGVIADFREPNVVRVAPVPLYNSFHDVWRFASVLRDAVGAKETAR